MTIRGGLITAVLLTLIFGCIGCKTALRRQIVEASLDSILATELETPSKLAIGRNRRVQAAANRIKALVIQYYQIGDLTYATTPGTKTTTTAVPAYLSPPLPPPPPTDLKLTLPDYQKCKVVKQDGDTKRSIYQPRVIEGADARRTVVRNRIAFNLLAHIRAYHESNYDDLYEGAAVMETLVDWTVLALGGAGSFFSGGTSQTLSGISAGVVGAEASLSTNFLNDLNKFQLLLKMEAVRSSTRADILRRLTLPDSEYPLISMAYDMQSLLEDGSIRDAATKSARDSVAELTESLRKAKESLDALSGFMSPTTTTTDNTQSGSEDGGS